MIEILGLKRLSIIAVLVALNVLLAAALYLVLIPREQAKKNELSALQGAISQVQADLERTRLDTIQMQTLEKDYRALENDGFFKTQSRRQAQDLFQNIQVKSGVTKAVANIDSGIVEENSEAQKAKHKILKSHINIKLEAIDDVDIFHYLFLIHNLFPGDVSLERLRIKREGSLNATVLRGISTGENPLLVSSDIDITWRTMIPETQILEDESTLKSPMPAGGAP